MDKIEAVKEYIKDEFIRFYTETGKVNEIDFRSEFNLSKIVSKLFGDWHSFLEECNLLENHFHKYRTFTKEKADKEIIRVFDEIKRENQEFNGRNWKKHSTIDIGLVSKFYGEKVQTLIETFPGIKEYNDVSKDDIIQELHRVANIAESQNKDLSAKLWNKYAYQLYKINFPRIYDSFSSAMQENGFINTKNLPYPKNTEEFESKIFELYNNKQFLSISLICENLPYRSRSIAFINENYGGFFNLLKKLNIENSHKKVNKSASLIIDIVSNILNEKPELEYSWDWLKNDKKHGKLYVDAYFKKHNLVIEYNGIQHYEHNTYFHKTFEDFEYQKKNDALKLKLLRENNINVIVFPYYEFRRKNLRLILENKLKNISIFK